MAPPTQQAALEAVYRQHCAAPTAMAVHLPRLRALADGLRLAVEFGVKRGASSSALLLGADHVVSFDLVERREARTLQALAGDRWEYRIADSRTADVPVCDLLLIDSLHDYPQCRAELQAHGQKARRWLVFHDHLTFGSIGAHGETGLLKWTYARGQSVPLAALGIRPAIDEFQVAHPEWRIHASYSDSHGLLVLRRDA